jgi:hypothetical protein
MHAHWRDGMDLENDDDLRIIARDATPRKRMIP